MSTRFFESSLTFRGVEGAGADAVGYVRVSSADQNGPEPGVDLQTECGFTLGDGAGRRRHRRTFVSRHTYRLGIGSATAAEGSALLGLVVALDLDSREGESCRSGIETRP